MQINVYSSAEEIAHEAARWISSLAKSKIESKGSFSFAISGGRTPWEMLAKLAQEKLPWEKIFLFQVDERIAPEGHKDRNLTQLFQVLQGTRLMTRLNIFPMHVISENLQNACEDYNQHIQEITGNGKLDLIHLGMGSDGHTASLIPGDKVCEVENQMIALTDQPYQGRQRMTMTFPLINQAENILWLITGEEKKEMLVRMLNKDLEIPAGKIRQDQAVLMTDLL